MPDWQVQENLCLLNLRLGLGWFFGLDASPAAGLNVTASQEIQTDGGGRPRGKQPSWKNSTLAVWPTELRQVSQGHIQAAVLL